VSNWAKLGPDDARALAEQHGTPFYFYDQAVLLERVRRARAALPGRLLYAVKANPNEKLVRALYGSVDGLDVSSLGEVELAARCGWDAATLSFVGPGKTPHELAAAVERGVLVSVESVRELDALAAIGKRARVRLRLNPTRRSQAYRLPMIGGPSPFGIDEEDLSIAVEHLRRHSAVLEFDGIHVHPGAQCTSVGAFAAAAAATLDLAEQLQREHGLAVRTVNFGGGFGVLAPGEELDVEAVGKRLAAMLAKFREVTGKSVEAVLELGRWLVGPAGIYVAQVVSEKRSRGQHFVILDGGMNHHLGATGHLAPDDAPRMPLLNLSRPDAPRVTRTVVGPLCTPLDSFGVVELAEPRVGDLLGVVGSGAYGYSFSPLLFLGHPAPAEIVR
jgi:diaminopimelate decarboxylase